MQTMVIAEIASNWEGSISKAKKIILASKKAGGNAVKFQMWRAKICIQRNILNGKS